MNYGLVLAGGKGTRMGATEMPKQFLELAGVPIIVRCVENMVASGVFDKIVVVCNRDYLGYCRELLEEYGLGEVEITEGGANRLWSAVKGVEYIRERYGVEADDVFLAHDAVRIFTEKRIFEECVSRAREHGAATTVYYLEETVVEADEEGMLYRAYPRERRFSGQSPQAFRVEDFMRCFERVGEARRAMFTDLGEVMYANGERVYPVMGDKNNIKITTRSDLEVARGRVLGV